MYYVYWQKQDKIEITLSGELSEDEFIQVIHQLESLCAMYQEINVLLDAREVERYAMTVLLEEMDFYKKYYKRLKRVAIVADMPFEAFVVKAFNKFVETEFKFFKPDEIETARSWIFPPRLP